MTKAQRILLISSTRYRHGAPLAHCKSEVMAHLEGVKEVLFIPFARPGTLSHEAYSELAAVAFTEMGKKLVGIQAYNYEVSAVQNAEAIFIGGGNTFLLLHDMYKYGLIEPIRARVGAGMPYMGTSAGSNVAGRTINNTNDMPIIYPPSFDALGLVPFNINPHLPAQKPDADHMGETREDRIHEFHGVSDIPVVGIREDSHLRCYGETYTLVGKTDAILFRAGQPDTQILPGENLQF